MFGKKKPERPKRNHSGKNLAQYGLFDVPTNLSFGADESGSIDDGGDSDLEAELLALASDSGGAKPKRQPRRDVIPASDLDAMVSASLKDIPSDEEVSGDEDDPDLLSELNEITGEGHAAEESAPPVSSTESSSDISMLLRERLKLYEAAEAAAKEIGETGRARRFARGITTLKDLVKQANAGKPINNDDIPPEVSIHLKKPAQDADPATTATDPAPLPTDPAPVPTDPAPVPTRRAPTRPAPLIPTGPAQNETGESDKTDQVPPKAELSEENMQLLQLLNSRKDEYKIAALRAKKAQDSGTAIQYIKIAKQFEAVIKAVQSGQPVDLSQMPGPPPPHQPQVEENTVQTHNNPENIPQEEDASEGLIAASSVAEALQQRLAIYRQQEEAAKEQANSGKARRMGRIVKQYEQAIKLNNAGKPIPVDDLPTPPGYAPIPVPGANTPKPEESKPKATPMSEPSPVNSPDPDSAQVRRKPSPPPRSAVSRLSGNHIPTTRAEKQLQFLLARQKEFKLAALSAKKKGEMEEAKEFLKTAKGFEPLIEASQGGLPVDITTLPIPPAAKSQLENEFDIIVAEECTEDDTGNLDVLARLESQLTKQLKMCLTTRDHNKAIGDVAGTNRFEQLALSVTKDLDIVRVARRNMGSVVPKFHYETKNFAVVKTFTDLNDNDLELIIIRGISYTCTNPKDVDTYVKFEFPYPQEEPVRDRTSTVKDSNNPEYNATFTLPIHRTARPCLRVFKRHAIKFEVYSRGGLFRGDTLLGTVTVKLQPLETQCELHDSFDLMEGRKKVGGKLEVQLRVRNPLINRQVEQLSEKWLVVDQ